MDINKQHDLERRIQQLENAIQYLIMPCIQAEDTDESKKTANVMIHHVADATARIILHQQYGYWSRPLPKSMHTLLNVGAQSGRGISIASTDERHRPLVMRPGDVFMGDNTHQCVWITNGNTINIVTNANVNITAPTKVTITSPEMEITGNLLIDGNLHVKGDIDDANDTHSTLKTLRDDYNKHKHGDPQGGQTTTTDSPTP